VLRDSLIATGYGTAYSLGALFYCIGPMIAGQIIDKTGGYTWVSLFFLCLGFCASYMANLAYKEEQTTQSIKYKQSGKC